MRYYREKKTLQICRGDSGIVRGYLSSVVDLLRTHIRTKKKKRYLFDFDARVRSVLRCTMRFRCPAIGVSRFSSPSPAGATSPTQMSMLSARRFAKRVILLFGFFPNIVTRFRHGRFQIITIFTTGKKHILRTEIPKTYISKWFRSIQ